MRSASCEGLEWKCQHQIRYLIAASQSTLQPIQEVIADSPSHSTRSSSPNLQDSQVVMTIQQAEQEEMSGANQLQNRRGEER